MALSSIELIKKLCGTFGPSGCEKDTANAVMSEIADIAPNARFDKMGNLIAIMRFGDISAPSRPRVAVFAHMDEVGFMINEVKAEGYLGFDTVGGISESVMAGRRVLVLGKKGYINGVIASKAIHHKSKDERQNVIPTDKLYIDIGARNADEAREYADIGDFAVFESEFYEFGEGYVKAKALDDRMGCAAMVEIMRSLCERPPQLDVDICFCFTVREEIGLSGAKTAAFELRPDIAVVLETTAVADIADTPASQRVADTGGGVAVSVMDRSTVYDRELAELALELAREHKIPAQVKRYVSGGNDAGTVHKTADGVRTAALSVPTRYLHSPACVAHMNDYISQKELCEQIIRNIDRLYKEKV